MNMNLRIVMAAMFAVVGAVNGATAQDYYASGYGSDAVSYDKGDEYVSQAKSLEKEMATMKDNIGKGGMGCGCSAGCNGCDACQSCDTCQRPAWEFRVDLTMLRYHKTGGVQVGSDAHVGFNPELAELGFVASPRFHLRRYGDNGMFMEISYFEFNHSANTAEANSDIFLRTYTFDWIAGERFQLNEDWDVEVTGGTRIWNFTETLVDDDGGATPEYNRDNSWGYGGIVGLEARRKLGDIWLGGQWYAYGGANFAIVHGDHAYGQDRGAGVVNVRMTDENFIHTEISAGTEYSRVLDNGSEIFMRYGGQWITYQNATSQFSETTPGAAVGLPNETWSQPGADAGFGGINFSIGLYR